ncbi:MAG: DMT family transporter, partial [Flammeovirgaceae bacterium]|nr:DMT family transporter [Flammeovirgaceae bacterium]MDW8288605.1 DMT family transporter [Flammeovirgaceae bacterium]
PEILSTPMKYVSQGIKYITLASLCFALQSAIVRFVPHIPAIELVLFRAVFTLIFSYSTLKVKGIYIWGKRRIPLLMRGIFGTIALLLQFFVIQAIPLATAKTLFYLAPIFAALIATIWLKEKIFKMQWVFFLVSFLGIVLIKGFDSRIPLFPLVAGIISAICSAAVIATIASMKNDENPHVIVFYFPLVAFPIGLVGSLFVWVTPSWTDLFWLFLIGVFTQLGQVTMTKAYQADHSAKISAASYVEIVFIFLLGWILFEETFDWKVLLGICLVIVGVLFNLTYPKLRPHMYDFKEKFLEKIY